MDNLFFLYIDNYIKSENSKDDEYNKLIIEQFIKTTSELNNGISPTLDNLNRFHSPIDNYNVKMYDIITKYKKGLYIPIDGLKLKNWRNINNKPYKIKRKAFGRKIINELAQLNNYFDNSDIEISFGTEWIENNNIVCNVYINGNYSIINIIGDLLTENENEIIKSFKIEEPAKGIITEGFNTIKGTVVKIKSYQTKFGEVPKMIVKLDNNSSVFGTIPAKLYSNDDFCTGCEVEFSAQVTVSNNDTSFGFFKRPTKIKILKIN